MTATGNAVGTANGTIATLTPGQRLLLVNCDDAALYVKYGASASSSSFTFIIPACTAQNDGTVPPFIIERRRSQRGRPLRRHRSFLTMPIFRFPPKLGGSSFNPAAPGAIGGTTAGSGAFTTLTASGTLAVTSTTTMTGRLTANGGITVDGGTNLLTTNTSLTDYTSGTSVSFTSNAPSGVYSNPVKWIAIDDAGTTYDLPLFGPPP